MKDISILELEVLGVVDEIVLFIVVKSLIQEQIDEIVLVNKTRI
jgi:hypothetical protein